MLTPREHIEQYRRTKKYPSPLWCHALDVLKHVLKGDVNDTFFKDQGDLDKYLKELSSHLDNKPKEVDSFLEERHNAFTVERKWKRMDSEYGDLVIERHLDGDIRPFDDYRKRYVAKPAVTLVLDMSIPWVERSMDHMSKRHQTVYHHAIEANREGRPCRVVAACNQSIDECEKQKWLFVLKDFDDPIFPSIWAAFEHNRLCNSFINATQDYFIGTRSGCNGSHQMYNLAEDLEGDVIVIEPHSRVYYNPER